jgi:NAD(P)-dependent dehydrogenase (short-subunit alcohol dehydrogenase family)
MIDYSFFISTPPLLTLQGFEIHYATNFLGHFALTQHLLPAMLPQKARVVVVSSILHSYAGETKGGGYGAFFRGGVRGYVLRGC